MGSCVRIFILLVLLVSIHSVSGLSSTHPDSGNIDLPFTLEDWGEPTTFCKDIWTKCGRWAPDWGYPTPPCCRSMGPNKAIKCRQPQTEHGETWGGFDSYHQTYCLPIIGSNAWRSSLLEGALVTPPRGDTGDIINQEIVEQLTRIADALETKGEKKA